MGRITFVPFNNEGEIVKRGVISISDKRADRATIIDKVAYTGRRDGIGKIVHVEVENADRSLHSAWDIRTGAVVQTDGPGSETFESAYVPADTGNQGELEMPTADEVAGAEVAATKPRGRPKKDGSPATPKAAKAPKEPKVKGPTKKGRVLEMMQTGNGVTVDEIVKDLNISPAAARALIGDCQRMGNVVVSRTKVDDVNRYTAVVSDAAVAKSTAQANDATPSEETPSETPDPAPEPAE